MESTWDFETPYGATGQNYPFAFGSPFDITEGGVAVNGSNLDSYYAPGTDYAPPSGRQYAFVQADPSRDVWMNASITVFDNHPARAKFWFSAPAFQSTATVLLTIYFIEFNIYQTTLTFAANTVWSQVTTNFVTFGTPPWPPYGTTGTLAFRLQYPGSGTPATVLFDDILYTES
jgi:hypothetical protein